MTTTAFLGMTLLATTDTIVPDVTVLSTNFTLIDVNAGFHQTASTAVHGIVDTSKLVLTTDPRVDYDSFIGYFRTFRQRVANVANVPVDIVWLGDGPMEGFSVGSDQLRSIELVTKGLQAVWNPSTVAGGEGFIPAWHGWAGYAGPGGTPTNRWVFGPSGAAPTLTDEGYGLGRRAVLLSTIGQNASITVNCDSFDLAYTVGPLNGTLSVQIDGGTVSTINTNNATQTSGMLWSSGSLGYASHTVVVTYSAGYSQAVVDGIMVFHGDSAAGVRMWDASHFKYTSSQFASATTTTFNGFWASALAQINPAMVIVSLGSEDIGNAIPAFTTEVNLVEIYNLIHASCTSDPTVVFVLPWTYNTNSDSAWQPYVNAILAAAAFVQAPTINLWDATGDPVISALWSDTYNPSTLGAQMIANDFQHRLGVLPETASSGGGEGSGSETLDQIDPPVAPVNFNGQRAINLSAPEAGGDATNLTYVTGLVYGLPWASTAQAASLANVTPMTGLPVVDSYVTNTGDQILLLGQTNPVQNGKWQIVGVGDAFIRPPDFETGSNAAGKVVSVQGGAANSGLWTLLSTSAVTIDASAQTWTSLLEASGLFDPYGAASAAQTAAEAFATGATATETSRAITAEASKATAAALSAETTRATGVEALLATSTALTTEAATRAAADTTNAVAITAEQTRAESAEALRQTMIPGVGYDATGIGGTGTNNALIINSYLQANPLGLLAVGPVGVLSPVVVPDGVELNCSGMSWINSSQTGAINAEEKQTTIVPLGGFPVGLPVIIVGGALGSPAATFAAGGTNDVVTDSAAAWAVNYWGGALPGNLIVLGGPHNGESYVVVSNTPTTVTITGHFTGTIPATGTRFVLQYGGNSLAKLRNVAVEAGSSAHIAIATNGDPIELEGVSAEGGTAVTVMEIPGGGDSTISRYSFSNQANGYARVDADDGTGNVVAITSGSSIVTDTKTTADDCDKSIYGVGIPEGSRVGKVIVGASYTLLSAKGRSVNATATLNSGNGGGAAIAIGSACFWSRDHDLVMTHGRMGRGGKTFSGGGCQVNDFHFTHGSPTIPAGTMVTTGALPKATLVVTGTGYPAAPSGLTIHNALTGVMAFVTYTGSSVTGGQTTFTGAQGGAGYTLLGTEVVTDTQALSPNVEAWGDGAIHGFIDSSYHRPAFRRGLQAGIVQVSGWFHQGGGGSTALTSVISDLDIGGGSSGETLQVAMVAVNPPATGKTWTNLVDNPILTSLGVVDVDGAALSGVSLWGTGTPLALNNLLWNAVPQAQIPGLPGLNYFSSITPGGATWAPPAGVFTARLRLTAGGGQAGGSAVPATSAVQIGSGAGGAGQQLEFVVSVVPGTAYSYTVPLGGATTQARATSGNPGANGVNGNNASITIGGITYTAIGGGGGLGSVVAAVGQTNSGAYGSNLTLANNGFPGGGGRSALTTGVGQAPVPMFPSVIGGAGGGNSTTTNNGGGGGAQLAVGGTPPSGGGNGTGGTAQNGAGGTPTGLNGNIGGNGASGQIEIWY